MFNRDQDHQPGSMQQPGSDHHLVKEKLNEQGDDVHTMMNLGAKLHEISLAISQAETKKAAAEKTFGDQKAEAYAVYEEAQETAENELKNRLQQIERELVASKAEQDQIRKEWDMLGRKIYGNCDESLSNSTNARTFNQSVCASQPSNQPHELPANPQTNATLAPAKRQSQNEEDQMPKRPRADTGALHNSSLSVGTKDYITEAARMGVRAPFVILHSRSIPVADRYIQKLADLLGRTGQQPIIMGNSGYFIPFDNSNKGEAAAYRIIDRFDGITIEEELELAMDLVLELRTGSEAPGTEKERRFESDIDS